MVTALALERYRSGAYPFAFVSMDNCSHNGEKLQKGVMEVASSWLEKGFVEKGFIDYLSDPNKVSFPWFETIPSPEELDAYTKFIAAPCEMSVKAKRVTAKEKEVDNDKYAFRCFLLRLGFIGAEFKAERKILLQNLSGNSSWKNGAPEKEVAACE